MDTGVKHQIKQMNSMQGFFLVSSGAKIRPLSQSDLGDLFSQFEKKIPNLKKKKKIFFFFFENFHSVFFFFFFFLRIFIQSPHKHTHKLHDDNLLELHPIFLQFNGNSMCNS